MTDFSRQIYQCNQAIDKNDRKKTRQIGQRMGFMTRSLRKRALRLLFQTTISLAIPVGLALPEAVLRQMELDVHRIYFGLGSSSDQDQKKKQTLILLVFLFKTFPFLQYYQGYHEVAAVLLTELGQMDARMALISITNLYLRDFMEVTMDSTLKHCELVMDIVAHLDPELSTHLLSLQDFNSFFSIPWILTWFSHGYHTSSSQALTRIFDALLSSPPSFLHFLAATLILPLKSQLLDCTDMSEILSVMMGLKEKEMAQVEEWIQQAIELQSKLDIRKELRKLGSLSTVNTYHDVISKEEGMDWIDIEELIGEKARLDTIELQKRNKKGNRLIPIGIAASIAIGFLVIAQSQIVSDLY
jgi:hypothetical protein